MTLMAAVQMASGPQLAANLTETARLVAKAASAGARLVALPENFALMPEQEADRLAAAETMGQGPIQDFLSALAREHRLWIVGGTVPLHGSADRRVRAACLVYNELGACVGRYDKIHLFDVHLDNGERYAESSYIEAGDAPVVLDSPFGQLGIAVCYDLRFPELFRAMLSRGADLFVIPSAFTAHTGRAHWEPLVRARAIENLAYVIAPNQGGYHVSGRETHGDSMIVSPWGDILDRLARGSGVVMADIDLGRQSSHRRSLPSIHHRRIPT
jgi:deaminated glutathione amidase